jgi:methionyl-tRNA synthetase
VKVINYIIQHLIQNPMIFIPFIIWSFAWKGLALWRAARLNQLGWFIALIFINTGGLFEIIFIFITNKKYKKRNYLFV